ncbi:anaerobic ribonucleoside-triphosphate reductase activating protein [Thiococcus pfennigii]|nr:anaerobic ribonucleoside-triphosphate reductase activating protein [Thiococcus pfennigii]MBK1730680.1 anaerobic ribonucleoside-triphosphate reductase activating protein [Thiococcus pfennigii]
MLPSPPLDSLHPVPAEPRIAATCKRQAVPSTCDAQPAELRIAGFTPLTTVDYPGELAAVVFCHGCPWQCRYCHNAHLLADEDLAPIAWADIRAFLEQRRGLLDGVVFSGGEPTVQGDLATAMAEVKALGFKVGLHTGGPAPERLARLLPWLDWVGLDIKALPEDYPAITGVAGSGERAWASLHQLLAAGVALEVRTTLMPGWRFAEELRPLMDRLADAGVTRYALQALRAATARDPAIATAGDITPPAAAIDCGATRFADFIVRGV